MSDLETRQPIRTAQIASGRVPAAFATEAAYWLTAAAFLAFVWFEFVGHLPQSDFDVFLRAGGQVLHGSNPYPALGSRAVYSGSAFVYPWLTAFLFSPFALLTAHTADIAFFVVSGAAVVGGCRLAGMKDPESVVLVLAAATTIRGFQVGSLNALLFLGLVLVWRWRQRPSLVAVPLTIVVGSKLFLLPLLGWAFLSKRYGALARTVVGMLVLFAASFFIGPLAAGGYLKLLGALADHEGTRSFSLYGLLAEDVGAQSARLGCIAVAAAFILVGWWASRGRGERGDIALFGAAIAAALVLTPVLWSHYILLALVPVVLCRPRRLVLAAVCAFTWVVAPPASTPTLFDVRGDGHIELLYAGLAFMVLTLAARALYGERARRPAASFLS